MLAAVIDPALAMLAGAAELFQLLNTRDVRQAGGLAEHYFPAAGRGKKVFQFVALHGGLLVREPCGN